MVFGRWFGRTWLEAQAGGRSRLGTGVLVLRAVCVLVVLLAAILAFGAAGASAESLCTDTWTGPSEGSWTTAEDWSTGAVPTSTSVACIGSGKTVTVTEGANQTGVAQGEGTIAISGGSLEVANALEASSIKGLSMSGGALTGSGAVDVTGTLVGLQGKLEGSDVVVESGATGTITNVLRLYGMLTNDGAFTIGARDGLGGEESARFVNNGTLTIEGNEEVNTGMYRLSTTGSPPALVNNGTLKRTNGTGKIPVVWSIANDGAVEATQGILAFGGGGVSGSEHVGSWSAASGATIRLENLGYGAVSFALGSSVPVSGAFVVGSEATVKAGVIEGSSSTITVEGGGSPLVEVTGSSPSTIAHLKFIGGGTLSDAGEVDVTGSFTCRGGAVAGSGVFVVESGATAVLESDLAVEQRLVNKGTFTVTPGTGIEGWETGEFINDGTLTVNGEEFLHTGLYRRGFTGTVPKLVNLGTLQRTEGTGKITIEWASENYDIIDEVSGKFYFTDPLIVRESTSQYGGAENPSAPGESHASCGDPVSCATGNFSETQTDLSVGGRGVGLDLTRTYNAQAAAEGIKGAFGYGWTSSFSDQLVVNKETKTTTLHQVNGSTVPFTEETGGAFKAPVWTQDTLSGTEVGGYTLTLANQTKYKFAGATGRLESVTDRDGNATTLTYNGSGQLTTITDPVSRTIKLTYNGEGLVESAEDPMKHVVKYTYESGNLKSVTQPAEAGLRWQFKYEGPHEMTEMLDGREGKTVNEYNGSHQVVKQKDPAGHTLKFEYEPFHTKITNENTSSVTNEYFTSNDEPASITRGYGTASETTESFTYNEGGYVTSVTDGNGHVTKYGYNSTNDRTSMVDPNKDETKWEYDSTHDVISMTTPKSETTAIKREAHGNPETIERPAPESKTQVTKYKYKTTGELESVENPLKNVWKYEYDAKGDRTAEIDPATDKRTWEYNEDSQETATVSPRGNVKEGKPTEFTTKIERDTQGRPLTITDPLKHTTKYKYDGDGDVEQVTDGNSHTTKYTYNGDNQPTKVEAPNKAVTETEYDGAGQVIKQIDGNKHATEYKHNAVEEVTEVIDPLKHKTLKEYDAAGNLKKLEDPAKRTTTYKYDPANRLEEVSYSSGNPATVTYEYDKDGDRTKMTDGTGTTKYTYDQLDRLTESENGHKEVVKYEYDLANEQTMITYPNEKAITHAFDKAGRLEKITDWNKKETKFTYSADSELTATSLPTEVKDEDKYTYNDADQMTEVKMEKSTEVLASLVYTRDSDGQVKKITSKGLPGAEVTENTYDENNRLTKYGTTEYKYDSANNPTKEASVENKYNEGSELEKGGTTSYSYDELDERTKQTPEKGPATTYGYDQAGDLTSVERPEGESKPKIEDSYAYNGEGLRVSQTINGTTGYFAWDVTEGTPLSLSDGTNSYIYGPDGAPVEQINSAGTPTYLHHDQQGSTRLLTGSTGTVTGKCTYGAYGTPTCEGTTTTPLGYDGQYTSGDTGLIYMRARVYDPATAQFLSVDPIAPISLAPYNYAYDSPVNAVDPTGLLSWEDVSEAAAGALDTLTFGGSTQLAGKIFDFNAACANFGTAGEIGGVVGVGLGLFDGETEAELAFTAEQDAVIQLAKDAKRSGGLTQGDAGTLREWAKEYGLPSRGPEIHPNRPGWAGENPHIHIGPVNHIPVVP